MLERLIYIALQQGIADVAADIELLRGYFRQAPRCLAKEEIDAIEEYWLANPPTVQHQYPRSDAKFPLWAIILQNEAQAESFLADEGEDLGLDDLETLGGLDPAVEYAGHSEIPLVFTRRYQVLVYTTHPDMTVIYYELVRFFLMRARALFKEQAEALDLQYGGGDLFPDPRYIPEHVFARQFNMSAGVVERIIGPRPARAFKVGGIHIARGSLSSNGGVSANIDIPDVGDDS